MKPRSLFTLRQTTRATAAGFLLASAVLPAAAEFLWSASATTNSLSLASNWAGGTVPATSTTPTTSQNTDILVFTNAAQAGALTYGGNRNLGGTVRTVILANSATFSNEISNGGLDVVSSGSAHTLNLGGANSYSGATSVGSNVTLAITATGSINSTSGISVAAGGTFRYNSSTALTVSPTLNGTGTGTGTGSGQRAVLSGTDPINAAVALDNPGDVISPGNSPGIQTYTMGQICSSFSYDWELNNFTDTTAGTDFDQIGITGTLALTGGSDSYILNVLGLTEGNAAGLVSNFGEFNRSWTILTSAGITGFNAAYWTINTDGFTDPDTGNWSLDQVGNNLLLSYAPIPEPRTPRRPARHADAAQASAGLIRLMA